MAITYLASGGWASGSTSLSPALPAGATATTRMVLFVGAKPFSATINEPSGWTRIGTQQTNGSTGSGIDTGSVTWSVFYRDWQSGDAAPTVSVTSGNVSLAVINGYDRGFEGWETPAAYHGSDTSSGTGYSATFASSSGALTVGDQLIHGTVIAGNNATFSAPTLTATSATISAPAERPLVEGGTTTGNDLEASAANADVTAGTSTADAVGGWTLSVAQTGGGSLVRLRESKIVTPTGITSGETFGTASIRCTLGQVGGIASIEAFGSPTLGSFAEIVCTGIASAEALGVLDARARVSLAANGDGIVSAEAFGAPSLAGAVSPAAIGTAEVFGTPTLQAWHTVICTGISSAAAFGSPSLFARVVPTGIVSAEAFGATSLASTVSPTGIVGAEAFGTPVLSSDTTISPTSIASAEAFGTQSFTVNLSPTGIASAQVFGAAAVTATLAPTGIASAQAFGNPAFTLAVSPVGIVSATAFGTASLNLTVAPAGIATVEAFGTPLIGGQIVCTGIASAQAFGTPSLSVSINSGSITSLEAFGVPILGDITVAEISMSFYHPADSAGGLTGGSSVAEDVSLTVSSGFPGTDDYPVVGHGILRTGATPGTAQLRFRAEVAAIVTAREGMTLIIEKIG